MADWQKNIILIAKNTLVWLWQLSEKYQKKIQYLDEIPEAEIEYLKSFGFNAIWLIGMWERSPASQKIKRLYGKKELISSAYSIFQYEIAENLGGQKALDILRKKLMANGMFLACDIVPNHTGLDSPWLTEHPEWYISSHKNPVENWEFNSPNLLDSCDAEVHLEDGYYDETRAAEVFLFRNKNLNRPLYVYHGNDGTSMPWNDTAQLNYLNAELREEVKNLITGIAKQFDIVRLDAAMTLVKQHFHRLWFPPGDDVQCIPTRESFRLSQSEFDELMPLEFWQEVMQAIKKSAPNTLLMAEAFWLMEKFFIQELDIHRVYNSAFMHNLRDEKNQAFRSYLADILFQDPHLLERFVNYMTTPDEKTAYEQFGKSKKYFGTCALIATMPGLPLFGHGQIEGLSERYGMDIDRPFMDETPDEGFINQHRDYISPLLFQRERFSSAENFSLLGFCKVNNAFDENVIAFSNKVNNKKSLMIFNNQNMKTEGYVCDADKSGTKIKTPTKDFFPFLKPDKETDTFQLRNNFLDLQTGSKFSHSLGQITEKGLHCVLEPYDFFAVDIPDN